MSGPWRERWGMAEAILGLFMTFFIGFALPTVLVFGGIVQLFDLHGRLDPRSALALLGGLLTGALAVWLARTANQALYSRYPALQRLDQLPPGAGVVYLSDPRQASEPMNLPYAVVLALHAPRLHVIPAVVLGLWWLAHCGVGVLAGVAVEHSTLFAGAGVLTGRFLLARLLCFGLTFATSCYLLLAAGTVTQRTAVLTALWRARVLISAGVALATVIPQVLT